MPKRNEQIARRPKNRKPGDIRPVKISRNWSIHGEGSVLIEMGNTKVLCTASVENRVPPFLRGTGKGWVTAEYGMLPRSTNSRMQRESAKGKIGGRTYEIQRLIGRALRSVVDLESMGERSITIDCDVLQADGGTRTAAITGSFVALHDALAYCAEHPLPPGAKPVAEKSALSIPAVPAVAKKPHRLFPGLPIRDYLAAVSVGIVNGVPLLDLDYPEDSAAQVDMNIVMTSAGEFVEVQGTAEGHPFSAAQMQSLINLARSGIEKLISHQKKSLRSKARRG